ncbi:hypothetical protein [Sulfitobacter guttiformis]|uniref:Uncharacterized protein n=1 Tax=Sulfitobacter guttiformis TaxID=74349 RepID=A0A420DU87_9RHOB|nr:hypothetical protein [Sulfitobacter guttiformis]KIN71206.1 hypothetical protein Z949_364 [Sulfitobacter guttiformis KCTC 32187]RKE97677.1 hypothetical protein C8N30_2296 [Sulfitobacter guttiformis]
MSYAAHNISHADHRNIEFLQGLPQKSTAVAQHVIAAWDGFDVSAVNDNLHAARDLLAPITRNADAAGFCELGLVSQACEEQIDAYFNGPYVDLAICPGQIVWAVDIFVETCNSLTS